MARLFKIIKNFLLNLWNFFDNRKIQKINSQLEDVVKDQHKQRKEFLHELRFYLRKYLKKDASGKYIPLKGKNKAAIYTTVMDKYGRRMKELNITFSKNLQIKL